MIIIYDLRTNFDISTGFSHCHSSLDLVLTATGDLALISGIDEIKQRILLYLGIPKGERFDPKMGSSALDYLHEKNTVSNMRNLEQDIFNDMKYQFPELPTKSVTCSKSIKDPQTMYLDVRLSDTEMSFLYTPDELIQLTSSIQDIYGGNSE